MLQNILKLKSGSLGAKLFAYQEVRVPGLLGVIVLCSWERHLNLTIPHSTEV